MSQEVSGCPRSSQEAQERPRGSPGEAQNNNNDDDLEARTKKVSGGVVRWKPSPLPPPLGAL